MGEIQTSRVTRNISRSDVLKKTPGSDGKKKRTSDEVDCCSRRSISSPPFKAREYLSESQSGSDFDDHDNLDNSNLNDFQTPPEKLLHLRKNITSPTGPHSEVAHAHVKELSGYSPSMLKVTPSRNHAVHRPIKKDDKMHSIGIVVGIGTCVSLIALFIIFVVKYEPGINKKPVKPKTLGEIEEDIFRDLDKLKSETKQDKKFWGEVYSGLASLSEPSPRQPVVLLLAVPQDVRRTAVCLAHHIADIVHQAFGDTGPPVKHDTRDHLQLAWDEHKLVLDNQLSRLSEAHAAVIYNLELLPALTATLLHGYCDNDNAPHKRSVLLLLLELPVHQSSVEVKHLEVIVERRLHHLWKADLEQDHIPGLLSRVTSQTMMVLSENNGVLDRLCPL